MQVGTVAGNRASALGVNHEEWTNAGDRTSTQFVLRQMRNSPAEQRGYDRHMVQGDCERDDKRVLRSRESEPHAGTR